MWRPFTVSSACDKRRRRREGREMFTENVKRHRVIGGFGGWCVSFELGGGFGRKRGVKVSLSVLY